MFPAKGPKIGEKLKVGHSGRVCWANITQYPPIGLWVFTPLILVMARFICFCQNDKWYNFVYRKPHIKGYFPEKYIICPFSSKIYFYQTQVSLVRSIVSNWLTPRTFADLTDVTLVDEDTKSILTDNANRVIQGNQAMHVTNSLVCKFVNNASGAIWWSNLEPIQVVTSGGQICN